MTLAELFGAPAPKKTKTEMVVESKLANLAVKRLVKPVKLKGQ